MPETAMPLSRIVALVAVVALCGASAFAAASAPPLHRVATVDLPGQPLKGFDIGDVGDGVYALADRSNAGVDLIDVATLRNLGRIGGFAGNRPDHRGGPNGVHIVGADQVWAGDGDSSVKIADLRTRRVVASVATGGRHRVDELTVDTRDHLVIAANNADRPAFVTLISTRAPYPVLGRITLPRATNGLEQPLWDPRTGDVYLAIPELDGVAARGGIAVIDPRRARLRTMWPVADCMPAGLALGPGDHLLVGCSDDAVAAGFPAQSLVIETHDGSLVKRFAQVGGSDEVGYDRRLGVFVLAAAANPGGPVLGVITARSLQWSGNVASGLKAHSVAVDPRSGRVFVPVAAGDSACSRGCVEVLGR